MKKVALLLSVYFLLGFGICRAEDSAAFLDAEKKINEFKKAGKTIDKEIAKELLLPIAKEFMTDDQRMIEMSMIMNMAEIDNFVQAALTVWFQEEVRTQKRLRYIEEHNEIDEKIKMAIREGKLIIGMNRDQAIASWGKPEKINRTVTRAGNTEQWVFGSFGPFVYFENGILTAWQD